MIPDPRERPTLSIEEAGRLLGLGRSASYHLAARDAFPVPVIRMGRRVVVATARVVDLLGLSPDSETPVEGLGLALVTVTAKRGERGSG